MGSLVIALVLLVQALGFADGGVTALGANVFNMALIGTVLSYYVFAGIKGLLPKSRAAFLGAVAAASWLSIILASGACAVELAISDTSPLRVALPAMLGVHAVIGIGEAVITTAVVALVLQVRPDLVRAWGPEYGGLQEFEIAGVS